jgi:thioredoxin-like negative regulator of GroEL
VQRLRINAIPLMAVFKGHELARKAGAMPAPAIQQFVEQAIHNVAA